MSLSIVTFCRGDLIWGKIYSFPWWPAIVIDAEDCGRDRKEKQWVFWFGDQKVSQIQCKNIEDFKIRFRTRFLKRNGKKFIRAVEESLSILAQRHHQNFQNSSFLFEWAANGFKTPLYFRPKKVTELPQIVIDALKKEEFQRKVLKVCEDDAINKIENLVPAVLKGFKQLEEICISCCNPNAKVVMQHPFFVGGICKACKKNVNFSCKLKFGCPQDFCIICGQGGTLVICSNLLCLRSFCDLCIEYLTPKGTYKKILKEVNWSCYLCKVDSRVDCLIMPRTYFLLQHTSEIPIPEVKVPINVIAHSDAVLSILKEKHFVIGEYVTTSACKYPVTKKSIYNKEFTNTEFCHISADLVCSSYFQDPSKHEVGNEDVKLLFGEFYKFMWHLDNARLFKSMVFFIFICDGELANYTVQHRLTRFLEVESVQIQTRKRNIYLWSNIPYCSSIAKVSEAQSFADNHIETYLFAAVVELLSKYFKLSS